MVNAGDVAPDFELPGTDGANGEEIPTHRLEDALDEGPVLLAFYAFDFHPACTEELCAIRDLSWFDVAPELTVLAVSTDRVFSHRKFAAENDVEFPLLSDSDGSVSESYGVLAEELLGHKRISKRAVFLIDEGRTVRYSWVADDPADLPDLSPVNDTLIELVE